jgi:hypothetical protein
VSWLSWHQISEQLASDAHARARLGDYENARALFAAAAEAENSALEALDGSKTRTIGITVVSTVSLWFKARQYVQAEQLALRWLASSHLPRFAVEQLRALLQGIWTAQTIGSAGISFLPGQVFVSVRGGQTVTGGGAARSHHREGPDGASSLLSYDRIYERRSSSKARGT